MPSYIIHEVESIPPSRNLVIMGDFNVNLLDDDNGVSSVSELKDMILERFPLHGLTQTVRKETRHGSGVQSSLIDHCWLSNMCKHIQTRNAETSSDHDAIISTIKLKGNVKINETTNSRNPCCMKIWSPKDLGLPRIVPLCGRWFYESCQ